MLWKLRNVLPRHSKKLVFDTLFQSHLNFMSPIWGLASCKTLKNAQVLQNRALRNVYDLDYRSNRLSTYLHHVGNHLPIRGICLLNIASYVFKVLRNSTVSNINSLIRPASKKTNYGTKSIETIGPSIFNKIPNEIKQSRHQHTFKWTLKCHLRKSEFLTSCFDSTFFDLII